MHTTLTVLTIAAIGAVNQPEANPGKRLIEERQQKAANGGMERWQESIRPSLGHEVIAQFEGDWVYHTKMWWDQAAPPAEVEWAGPARMIMGGRFLEMSAEGEMMGMPWQGRYMLGYDNVRSLFHLTAFSTMDTSVQTLWGSIDREGKVLTFIGDMNEPMTGEIAKAYKISWTIDSEDRWTQRVYEIIYGEPFVVMETVATRAEGKDG